MEDSNVVECEARGGPSLSILQEVQRLYQDKMDLIERRAGPDKLQRQVEVLRSWVSDLVSQNSLLARAVEDLELEATSRILAERRKQAEMCVERRVECSALRRRLARKDADLRGLLEVLRRLRDYDHSADDGIHFYEAAEAAGATGFTAQQSQQSQQSQKDNKKDRCDKVNELKIMNDSLQKENSHKDREIRRLNKDLQQYEQTIMSLKNELTQGEYRANPEVSRKDAEVTAVLCCNDREPVQPEESVLALRKLNLSLSEEAQGLRRACQLLHQQCRGTSARQHLTDDIIKEMRRQLRHAKNQLKKESSQLSYRLMGEMAGECESMGSGPARYLPRRDDGAGGDDDLPSN